MVVASVGLALVAAEVAVTAAVQRRASDRLAAAIGGDVEVHVAGRPLLLALLRGEIPEVRVTARRVPVDEGRITRLDVRLRDVRLPRGPRPLSAADARFEARLSTDDVAALTELPPGVSALRLTGDGLRIHTSPGVSFETSVTAAGGHLLIRADRGVLRILPRAEFRIRLPELPAGATVEHAWVDRGHLHATGPLDGGRLLG